MPRYGQPRRFLLANRVVHAAWRFAGILLILALLTACSPSRGATSSNAATPTLNAASDSPLVRETVYWSQGDELFALRASNGQVRWKVGGWSWKSPTGNGVSGGPAAPTLVDGTLYATVALDHAEAYALAATDGTTRWHTTFPGCFNMVGSAYPPLLAGGVLYVAISGHDCAQSGWVYAVRARDGSVA